MVCRNVQLEARLINDMLDLSRITHGKLKLELKPTDVHQVLQCAIDIVQHEVNARGIKLALALEAGDHHLLLDGVRLQQVFWNLLRNASKFARQNGVVSIRSANSNPGTLTIEISDDGAGIEPPFLEKIFDAFEQGSSRREGLGLGLAISKGIIEIHGGSICARSKGLGTGATFEIQLPINRTSNNAGRVPAQV
jgi:signal transduction histidine kinase